MSLAGLGSFGEGFAKTFNTNLVANAIINHGSNSALEEDLAKNASAADEKQKALDLKFYGPKAGAQAEAEAATPAEAQANAGTAIPTQGVTVEGQSVPIQGVAAPMQGGQVQAIPTKPSAPASAVPPQGAATPVQGGQAIQPQVGAQEPPATAMTRQQYSLEKARISLERKMADIKSRQRYYRNLGKYDMAHELDSELSRLTSHGESLNDYSKFINGDPDMMRAVAGYASVFNTDGSKFSVNDDGSIDLIGANGNLLQRNVQFTPEQKDNAFAMFTNMRNFIDSGDFQKYMATRGQIQQQALAMSSARSKEKHDAATLRLKEKELGLKADELKLKRSKAKGDADSAASRKALYDAQAKYWEQYARLVGNRADTQPGEAAALINKNNAAADAMLAKLNSDPSRKGVTSKLHKPEDGGPMFYIDKDNKSGAVVSTTHVLSDGKGGVLPLRLHPEMSLSEFKELFRNNPAALYKDGDGIWQKRVPNLVSRRGEIE